MATSELDGSMSVTDQDYKYSITELGCSALSRPGIRKTAKNLFTSQLNPCDRDHPLSLKSSVKLERNEIFYHRILMIAR